MTIRHLRIFKIVCEEGNITKAAKKLYMTQPAVSHVINDLEEKIGNSLFDRVSKRIYLNEFGKLFLDKAIHILELYDDLEGGLDSLKEQAALHIGSSITIANFWLPALLRKFESQWRKTPVRVEVESARIITEKLLCNEVDLALIEGVFPRENLVCIPFSSYKLVVLCAKDHPLASREEITIEELARQKLLLREKGSAIRDTFDSALTLHHLSADPVWTSVNSQALIQAAKNNLGITIMPDILVEKECERKELVQLSVQGLYLENQNYLAYHKDKFLSESMQGFLKILQEIPSIPHY